MTLSEKELPEAKKVYVGKSRIHRLGIFAKKNLKRGEIVYIIKGKVAKLNIKDKKTALSHSNWFGLGKDTWIDPEERIGKYQNHSSSPNCGIKGRVTVCAMKNIKKGEEITINYAITEEQPLWEMKDTTNGKELVRSIQYLPKPIFKKYLPYIPDYFQKAYYKYNNLHKSNK